MVRGTFRQHWLGARSGNIGWGHVQATLVGCHVQVTLVGVIQATLVGVPFRQHGGRRSGNIGGGPMHVTLVGRGHVLLTGGSSLLGEDGGLCSPWRHIIHST